MNRTDFYLKQLKQLVGGKITNLARSGASDGDDEFFGIVVTMPDGKQKTLLLLSDDEGNAPGSFELQ